MKVRFLKDGASPDIGPFKKGEERDLPAKMERIFIERGIAENVSAPGYVSKSSKKGKKSEEVKDNVG